MVPTVGGSRISRQAIASSAIETYLGIMVQNDIYKVRGMAEKGSDGVEGIQEKG